MRRVIEVTSQFDCDIRVETDSTVVDGKHGVGLLMLNLRQGQKLTMEFRGVDAPQAATAIEPLLVQLERGQLASHKP
jgi:phosphotransferase system HPr-like phosphotransfer protein